MTKQTASVERPILFQGDMVCAILAGRKTQTRRLVKPQPKNLDALWPNPQSHVCWHDIHAAPEYSAECGHCPHGKIGDRLWVKETHGFWCHSIESVGVEYAAGGEDKIVAFPNKIGMPSLEVQCRKNIGGGRRKRPSIFMPRWASRINLQITGIRVERLQDISATDAIAEGVTPVIRVDGAFKGRTVYGGPLWHNHECRRSPIDAYERIWEEITGAGSWAKNPWVWVIEFEVEKENPRVNYTVGRFEHI